MVYGLHLASSILNIVGYRLQSSLSIIRPRKSACWFPFPGIHSGSYTYVWPFLHSGNTIHAPSMVCHWKLVATNWLEKGSDLSSHVQTTAPMFSQGSLGFVCWYNRWQLFSSLVSLHHCHLGFLNSLCVVLVQCQSVVFVLVHNWPPILWSISELNLLLAGFQES